MTTRKFRIHADENTKSESMYFEDLSLCSYHTGPHDAGVWHSPLLAIGWLEHPHHFPVGHTSPEFLAKLELLVSASWHHHSSYNFRGGHDCTLCRYGDAKPSRPVRSHVNIWVPGMDAIYLAPGMITHYMGDHGYQPPVEFIRAVRDCPDDCSPTYYAALRASNADHAIPLSTKAEVGAEWARIREQMVARRRVKS